MPNNFDKLVNSKRNLFILAVSLIIFFGIPFTVIQTRNARDDRSKAESTIPKLKLNKSLKDTYYSDSVLVKFKKNVRSSLKSGNSTDTGIASINKVNSDEGVLSFEKVNFDKTTTDNNSELSLWRKIRIEKDQEVLKENLSEARKEVSEGKDSNKFSNKTKKLAKVLEKLKSDPNVEIVEPDYVLSATVYPKPQPTITRYGPIGTSDNASLINLAWGIPKIKANTVWGRTSGSSAIVAVIDTGVHRIHEDLAANMWVNSEDPQNGVDDDGNGRIDDVNGWDFENNDSDPMDDNGHGTMVAGIIGAVGNNGKGIAGVNQRIRLMAIKVLDVDGFGSLSAVAAGISYAANNGAHIINLSLGGFGTTQILTDAINLALSRDVVVIAAAGNDNLDVNGFYPASYPGVVAVSATDQNDNKAVFSNYGQRIDIAAPGVDIVSTCLINSYYCAGSGTSFASPFVAGLTALVKAKNPSFPRGEVVQTILQTADDIGTPGEDINFGVGRINVDRAVPVDSSTPRMGDINNDSRVNIFDASIMFSKWDSADQASDLNRSGKVDIFDASILFNNWTG